MSMGHVNAKQTNRVSYYIVYRQSHLNKIFLLKKGCKMELLFYTELLGQPNNVNGIEVSNGQPSMSFKGGASSPNTLCCLQNDYIVSALPKKSVLNVFEINRHNQQCYKIVTPGVVKSLCVSNDGIYISAGIGERILVWNAISGELLASLLKHYQDITQLCFTSDASYLVSSGLDGLVAVWNMSNVVDTWSGDSKEPMHCWSCHALPVTNLISSVIGGCRSRIFSSSLDRTIKIHDIALGSTLISLVFSTGITAFCVDSSETMLMAGGHDGTLFKVDLLSSAKAVAESNSTLLNIEPCRSNKDVSIAFKGHFQAITCMVFNNDCTLFVSGSADKSIKIWDVFSNQTVRTINCKSGITNLHITFSPPGISSTFYKPKYPFPKLARCTVDPNSVENEPKLVCLDDQFYNYSVKQSDLQKAIDDCSNPKLSEDSGNEVQNLKNEIKNLQKINKKLVDFAVDNFVTTD